MRCLPVKYCGNRIQIPDSVAQLANAFGANCQSGGAGDGNTGMLSAKGQTRCGEPVRPPDIFVAAIGDPGRDRVDCNGSWPGSPIPATEALKADAGSGRCRTPRRFSSVQVDSLQWRTTEPHRHLIGAVLCSRFAYLIGVTHVAPTDTDRIGVGTGVRHRGDHYSIAVDVDVSRGYRGPCEIHRVPPLHPAP
jgi:hypothetical protein